jgi:hypothetical protein
MTDRPTTTEADLQRLARRRVALKNGWRIHAFVYLVVNAGLVVLNLAAGGDRPWSLFPLLGWGLGLAIHGAVVRAQLRGIPDRQVEREVESLRRGLGR